jgi:hypothetical protein
VKNPSFGKFFIVLFVFHFSIGASAQNPVNWTGKQLMEPLELSNTITAKKDIPLIISIGPAATIPGSAEIGMINSPEGLARLGTYLKTIKKDKKIVIYCGCCPYEHCPNVRPAVNALKEMKFTNFFVLDLPHNIRKDWIDKGYPVSKS